LPLGVVEFRKITVWMVNDEPQPRVNCGPHWFSLIQVIQLSPGFTYSTTAETSWKKRVFQLMKPGSLSVSAFVIKNGVLETMPPVWLGSARFQKPYISRLAWSVSKGVSSGAVAGLRPNPTLRLDLGGEHAARNATLGGTREDVSCTSGVAYHPGGDVCVLEPSAAALN
jgi:hypothetical protein